ncbi:phosphonate metabolism transcriptional regulator PhnF [Meridianimarinicoccus sp. RP-17]|uniref:phosphonate metabolism transcriptional regulator PhnF n=1 Tax=Meridianimarinicoccus zhengii TaxID=2056810 RepID=UPI000DACA7B4|nr:phosphonate metabolism transcriptional regulator PhnF [Phycocomes zhengii]
MARTPLWRSIADSLLGDISNGRYGPGDKLPTEAQLSARFDVNRHTVRRALAELADAGLVDPRRGSGVYVAERQTDYPVGRRTRFHTGIAAAGRDGEKRILGIDTRAADREEAAALDLDPGAPIHVVHGLLLADGKPIGLFQSAFPADRLPGLPAALKHTTSVTRALAACGVPDYTRRATRLTAKTAKPVQARHLKIAEGAPVLRSVSVNIDPAGRPVEYGRTWFAGDRVTLTLGDG